MSQHISGGILDLVLTRCDIDDPKTGGDFQNVHVSDMIEVKKVSVIHDTGTTSDLYLVTLQMSLDVGTLDKPKCCTKTIREISKIDIDNFKDKILSGLPNLSDEEDVNTLVLHLNHSLSTLLDEFAPKKIIKIKNDNLSVWWDSKCDEARRERRRAEQKYKKDRNNNQYYQEYKEKQIDANFILNKQRDSYYISRLATASGDPKETYRIVNSLLDKEFGKQLQPNGKDDEIARNLQTFFDNKVARIYESVSELSKAYDIKPQLQHEEENPSTKVPMMSSFKVMSASEVASVIQSMGSKSCCLDPIPTSLLKMCLGELLPIITLILNSSLQSGQFPDTPKTAVVKALLKKISLDADDRSNYRPVSNLSFISKIIEKCVHLQLTEHIETNGLFPSLQSGYRKHHSCETAVVRIYSDLLVAIDKKSHALLVLIDLSAAFDTINHSLLISKLQNVYNIGGNVIAWIKSYLSQRKFKVLINDTFSDESPLEIGVPQGSILGPLLFILYTEGLQKLTSKYNFSIHLYADDTQIYFQFDPKNSSDYITRLNHCFSEIQSWMRTNYLKMNDSKTEVIELHSPYTSTIPFSSMNFEGCCIQLSESVKNLGFWFDKNLHLNAQVKNVIKLCYLNLRNISRIGSKLPKSLKIQLVHGCIHSILDYCNATYFGLSRFQLKKLQCIQNAAVRFIFGLKGKERFQSITPKGPSLPPS